MSLQGSFDFGSQRPPMPQTRLGSGINSLMVMAKPDEADALRIARKMEDIVADIGFGGRLVRPDLLHFTLYPIGVYSDVPRPIVDTSIPCGNAVRMRPFTVSLNMVKNFHRSNGPPPIVLCGDDGVLGIRALHEELKKTLAKRLGPRRSLPFEPHMTLSYRAMEIPDTPIEPINFMIREFVLVNSLLGRGQHDVLHRWKLGD